MVSSRRCSARPRRSRQLGHEVRVLSPDGHRTIPCPTYPEIRLALWPGKRLAAELDELAPDAIHVATEGPLGMAAARYCAAHGLAFTTSYHTQFPQYVRKRVPIPESSRMRCCGAITRKRGARSSRRSSSGASSSRKASATSCFGRAASTPSCFARAVASICSMPRPIFAYLGRVAVEKNIAAFLISTAGNQSRDRRRPGSVDAREPLSVGRVPRASSSASSSRKHLSSADVFVFPSRTDTFGLVMLEAMACGTPVAAYPVTGPIDVVRIGVTGVLDEDLARGARGAAIDREGCRRAASEWTWERASAEFFGHLVRARDGQDLASQAVAGVRDRCQAVSVADHRSVISGRDDRSPRVSSTGTAAVQRTVSLHRQLGPAAFSPSSY